MSEYIKFKFDKEEIFLGYTKRQTVRSAESMGVDFLNGASKIFSSYDLLIKCAMVEKQPEMTDEVAEKVIDKMIEKGAYTPIATELLKQAMGLYNPQSGTKKEYAIEKVQM